MSEKDNTQIKIEPDVAAGRFASRINVSTANDHFAISFIAVEPLAPADEQTAYLLSRIYLTPSHMRQFSALLAEQVKRMDDESDDSSST